MKADTADNVKALYKDFMSAEHRTNEVQVKAAYALKRERLLDDAKKNWWFDFLEETENETTDHHDEIMPAISDLEKEYPYGED